MATIEYIAYGGERIVVDVAREVGPRHMQSNGQAATFVEGADGVTHKVLVAALDAARR